ncbi:putative ubiquitin domain protein [Usnea florida]
MGCCHSTARDDEDSSPYSPSNAHGDSSSRAITSAPTQQLPDNSSPRTSSQAPETTQRSRTRRNIALGEQFNAPLRPHVWTAKKQWTRLQLDRERREFFDTRVTGHAEIWATLKVVVGLLADGDITTAQSILDAAAITVPTGDLKNGAYDEAGNLYQMPEYIISDPQNLILNQQGEIQKGEVSNDATDDDEAIERKREEKGKSVLKAGDVIKVRARLSDRGGPDVVISMGKDQAVRTLARRVQEEVNILGSGKVRIAYMGKILKDGETLQAQGWREGHVVNAFIGI